MELHLLFDDESVSSPPPSSPDPVIPAILIQKTPELIQLIQNKLPITQLLESGTNPLQKDQHGNSALDLLLDTEQYELLERYSRQVNLVLTQRNSTGRSRLLECISSNDYQACCKLLNFAGVDLDMGVDSWNTNILESDYAGYSPLHESCIHASPKFISLFLNIDDKLNTMKRGMSVLGESPLHCLCKYATSNFDECFELLVKAGVEIDLRDHDGRAAMEYCDDAIRSRFDSILSGFQRDNVSDVVMNSDDELSTYSTSTGPVIHEDENDDSEDGEDDGEQSVQSEKMSREEKKMQAYLARIEQMESKQNGKSDSESDEEVVKKPKSRKPADSDDGDMVVKKKKLTVKSDSDDEKVVIKKKVVKPPLLDEYGQVIKRKRGRPRKNPEIPPVAQVNEKEAVSRRESYISQSSSTSKVHKRDKHGKSLLHHAASKNKLELIKELLLESVDVELRDNAGYTALHEACLKGHLEIIRVLHETGARASNMSILTAFDPLKMKTIVHDPNTDGRFEVDKYSHVQGGDTPIHDACENGHFDVVKYLFERMGVDTGSLDGRGRSLKECCNLSTSDGKKIYSFLESFGGKVQTGKKKRVDSDDERVSKKKKTEDVFKKRKDVQELKSVVISPKLKPKELKPPKQKEVKPKPPKPEKEKKERKSRPTVDYGISGYKDFTSSTPLRPDLQLPLYLIQDETVVLDVHLSLVLGFDGDLTRFYTFFATDFADRLKSQRKLCTTLPSSTGDFESVTKLLSDRLGTMYYIPWSLGCELVNFYAEYCDDVNSGSRIISNAVAPAPVATVVVSTMPERPEEKGEKVPLKMALKSRWKMNNP